MALQNKTYFILFTLSVTSLLIVAQEGSGDRHLAPPEGPDDEVLGPQQRLFLPKLTTCNFTTQPGSSCVSCRQVLRCNANNVGFLKTCNFLMRFCNDGRCSMFPGPACSPTTTVASTTGVDSTTEGGTT